MSQAVRTQITCPRCGHTFTGIIEQIIDVGVDPQAKQRFLSGQINMLTCPNCGNPVAIGTPLVYHDPDKELLIIYVPMELNISQQERERVTGDLVRRLTEQIPPEKRRAYLLQPRQALTIPGMIDTILDADGITAEMREAQREKMRVLEMFLQVNPDQWPRMVEEQDAKIDAEYLQLLLVTAENAAQTGRAEMAEGLIQLYNFLIENTAAGREALSAAEEQERVIQEITSELEAMDENMTREQFMELVLRHAEDDQHIQALVGVMRPAFDYTFFQTLAEKIDAAQGDERERLVRLRDQVLDLTALLDQQTQAVLQRAADTLRVILNSEDLDAAIRPRLDQLDDTFLAVLQANIQAAEQQQNIELTARLKLVLERVLSILRESAPPQIRFINKVMSAETDEAAQELIEAEAAQFGGELLALMDAIAEDLEASDQPQTAARLRALRQYAETHVARTRSEKQQ